MTLGPRTWRVVCAALAPVTPGGSFCDWRGGYRRADRQSDAERRPCPRCGGPVLALPR